MRVPVDSAISSSHEALQFFEPVLDDDDLRRVFLTDGFDHQKAPIGATSYPAPRDIDTALVACVWKST